MTLPAILLGLILSVLLGSLYHILREGNGLRLLLFLCLSALGFLVGQWAGLVVGRWFMVGGLDVGNGTITGILFLAGGDWLTWIRLERDK